MYRSILLFDLDSSDLPHGLCKDASRHDLSIPTSVDLYILLLLDHPTMRMISRIPNLLYPLLILQFFLLLVHCTDQATFFNNETEYEAFNHSQAQLFINNTIGHERRGFAAMSLIDGNETNDSSGKYDSDITHKTFTRRIFGNHGT
jgi:hypothetical protein